MEIELKLLVAPADVDVDVLRQHPLLEKYTTEKPREPTLTGIYFDTPNKAPHYT